MALGRAGERAAGEHADADDADAGRPGTIEQPSVILCRIIRRQRGGRGRVEHVVDHLSAVEDARVDHLMQRRRVADCGEPEETRLALLAQLLERGHYLTETMAVAVGICAACRS